VFPESSTANSAPSQHFVPQNVSAQLLPSSYSSFSTLSHDTSLAFSIPYAEAAHFLEALKEIPAPEDATQAQSSGQEGTREEKKWMMRASKNGNAPTGVRNWIIESWTSFVDLLKVSLFVFMKLNAHFANLGCRTPTRATLSSWPWVTLLCT
jgi:hydroxymethylglutaryl-CoA reductase (NADPH)